MAIWQFEGITLKIGNQPQGTNLHDLWALGRSLAEAPSGDRTHQPIASFSKVNWLVVGNMFFHILGKIIPTDEVIFFRGFETTNHWIICPTQNPSESQKHAEVEPLVPLPRPGTTVVAARMTIRSVYVTDPDNYEAQGWRGNMWPEGQSCTSISWSWKLIRTWTDTYIYVDDDTCLIIYYAN